MLFHFQRCFFVGVVGFWLLVSSLFQDEAFVVAMVPPTPPSRVSTTTNNNEPPLMWNPQRRNQSVQLLADRAIAIRRQHEHLPFVCIAVAGGPGSGKSTLTRKVVTRINSGKAGNHATKNNSSKVDDPSPTNNDKAFVIPMDGYHYSKEQLRAMAGTEEAYEALLRRRGSPPTINAPQLVQDFQALDAFRRRTVDAGKEKSMEEEPTTTVMPQLFPDYSRQQSDPVPNALTIPSDTTIVFCEGLYVLALDSPDWAPLHALWDDTVFLHVPEPRLQERLIGRHLKRWTDEKRQLWGPGRKGAAAKVEANDLQNARWVTQHSQHHAHVILHNYG